MERNSAISAKAIVESSAAMHPDQLCMLCNASAFYRCLQCALWAYYCSECFKDAHSRINLFHTGGVWEVYSTVCMTGVSVFNHEIFPYPSEWYV